MGEEAIEEMPIEFDCQPAHVEDDVKRMGNGKNKSGVAKLALLLLMPVMAFFFPMTVRSPLKRSVPVVVV